MSQRGNAVDVWQLGQGVKTSPSHGENRGSIPLVAVWMNLRARKGSGIFFVVCGWLWGDGRWSKNAAGCLLFGKSRRLGDGSRCADGHPSGDQSHSRHFLMKMTLRATSDVAW